MKYLYKILRLFACPHKYFEFKKINIYDEYDNPRTELPVQTKYVLKCRYYGELKKFKV